MLMYGLLFTVFNALLYLAFDSKGNLALAIAFCVIAIIGGVRRNFRW